MDVSRKRKPTIVEVATVVVRTGELRRAASALSNIANVAAESLRAGDNKDRDRARSIITECAGALFSLVTAQIPEVEVES